jgi:hypothetical protein
MGSKATTTLGILVGLIGFLAMATIGVVAVNGANNPGFPGYQEPAGAGGSALLPAHGSWTPLDLNGDGYVSLAEAAGNSEVVTRFDRADRNKDGKLSKAEFDRLNKLPPAKAKKKAAVTRKRPTPEEASAAAGG